MAYLASNIPHFKCWVRKEFTNNHQEYQGEYLHALAIAVNTIPDRCLSFNVVFTGCDEDENIHGGAMWARMPITALIADNAVGIAQTIMTASRSIAERKAAYAAIPSFIGTFPNPAKIADVPLLLKDIASTKLAAGIGVATSGIALAKGLAALGKGGGGGAAPQLGGGAEGGAEAPAFNLVEGTESNAIQRSITGQENAVKAVVVSGDVTTAQSADRNIVDSSGF